MLAGRVPGAHRILAATLAVGAAAWLGNELARESGRLPAVWLANGVVLAVLLAAGPRRWPAYLAGAFAAMALADLPGRAPWLVVALAAVNTAEATLAAILLRRRLGERPDLTDPDTIGAFTLFAIVFAPALAALPSAGLLAVAEGVPFGATLRTALFADALGIATVTPTMLAVLRLARERGAHLAALRASAGALAVLAAVNVAVFAQDVYPLTFLVIPALMLVAFRGGLAGAAVATALTAAAAFGATAARSGPFALMAGESGSERILLAQLFVAVCLFTTFAVAAVLAERARLSAALAESETRYRMLADNTTDMIVLMDLDLRRTYVSPVAREIYGAEEADLIGRDPRDRVHPDDHAVLDATVAQLREGRDRQVAVYRLRRADGSWMWVEAACRRVVDPATGAHTGYLANVRDISGRKRAEDDLADANRRLEVLAHRDELTGLGNRRSFEAALAREWRRAARAGETLALLMVDLDRFKALNDRYGHPAGDDCLRRVARALEGAVARPGDFPARYGGEEFAILLPGTDGAGAFRVAERMRLAIRALAIPNQDTPQGVVTASVGWAVATPRPGEDPAALVQGADGALYEAKHAGRDTVRPVSPATGTADPDNMRQLRSQPGPG